MPEVTRTSNINATLPPENATLPPEPGATELLEEVADLSAGLGLGFMSFLGAIPGLLPCVALTVAALAILAIPMVVVGIVAGVVYLLVRVLARVAGRAASIFRPPPPEPERAEPTVAAPQVTYRLPARRPRAMV
jgi:hypothetical protein